MKKFNYLKVKFFLIFIIFLAKILRIKDLPPIPSVSALIKKKKKMLFILSFPKNTLNLPGGVIQELETPQQALIREVKEETNFDIKVGKVFGIYPWKDKISGINFCYEAKIIGGKLKSSSEGKAIWLDPRQNMQKFTNQTKKKIIKDYLRIR